MKIGNKWLQSFIKTDLSAKKIGEILTDTGLEVEGIEGFETIKGGLKGLVVGEVIEVQPHPNADKLKLTKVNIGNETLNIVCGAPNVAKGQKVVVATVGTEIYPKNGESFTIQKAKIRGEESMGMLCAEDEIGLSDNHAGIMVLDPKTKIGIAVYELFDAYTDEVYEIGLTPNRTDAMSHFGVARDLFAALSAKKIKTEFIPVEIPEISIDKNKKSPIKVIIENKDLCPQYTGIYLKNIEIKDSPGWLKNQLKSIGIEPINNVVDITNYTLHHLGQPLHAFDADKIKNQTIIVGNPKDKKEFITLDKTKRTLRDNDLMIKDGDHNPLCIAGVFGGLDSGVSQDTKNIFLESAYFDPIAVRKSAKNHGLNTDSSFRFERGVDPANTLNAIYFATDLLMKYAKGEIVGDIINEHPKEIKPHEVVLRYHKVDQVLGKRIHRDKIKEILTLLDFQIINDTPEYLDIEVPLYRADVTREIDVIEEILRILGYNSVEVPEKITFSYAHADKQTINIENKIATLLTDMGFNEIMTNSLVADQNDENKVAILNPLSKDLGIMRTSMIPSFLQTIAFNINRKQNRIKLFEFAKTYHKTGNKYIENKHLTIAISGEIYSQNWLIQNSPSGFFNLKGIVQNLLNVFYLENINEKPSDNPQFSEGIQYLKEGKTIVEIGIITPDLLKAYDVSQSVFLADINWDILLENEKSHSFKVQEVPKFPGSRRDLALLIDEAVTYQDLYNAAIKCDKVLIKSINLFDVYQGKNLPEGKKSYALSFYLQDDSKTLTEKEIDQVMTKLINQFKKQFNAELR